MSKKPSNPSARARAPLEPWQWPEEKWRGIVNKIRAGRSLKPKTWPNGARCAVALSFDSDHETTTLRFGDPSPGRLSAGEYGARAGIAKAKPGCEAALRRQKQGIGQTKLLWVGAEILCA